jgi:hypothetical protein
VDIKKYFMGVMSLVLILVLAPIVLPGASRMLIWTIVLCILSRSNLVYHTVNLEVHSILILFLAIIYGPWIAILVAILSTWPSKILSAKIGIYNPILVGMDMIHMIFIAIFASFLTLSNFLVWGIVIFILAEVFREISRFFTFHENPIKYIIMGTFYMTLAWFALSKFPYLFINWLRVV